ncbi:MAG: hypothetical protein ABI614_22560 [Planctomycetota bacterium]
MRADSFRTEVIRLLRKTPFEPFVLNLENGDRLAIAHPENIAFDPLGNGGRGAEEFHIVTSSMRFVGTFDGVTSIAVHETDATIEA